MRLRKQCIFAVTMTLSVADFERYENESDCLSCCINNMYMIPNLLNKFLFMISRKWHEMTIPNVTDVCKTVEVL